MPKQILLAEDSVTIHKAVQITFAREPFAVTVARDGEEALARARERPPDVIVTDTAMPGMGGYDLCAAIKGDPQLRHIPVLFLSGTHAPYDEAKGRGVGADGHLAKPFESQALLDKVTELASRAPAGQPLAKVATSPQRPAQPAATPASAMPPPAGAPPRARTSSSQTGIPAANPRSTMLGTPAGTVPTARPAPGGPSAPAAAWPHGASNPGPRPFPGAGQSSAGGPPPSGGPAAAQRVGAAPGGASGRASTMLGIPAPAAPLSPYSAQTAELSPIVGAGSPSAVPRDGSRRTPAPSEAALAASEFSVGSERTAIAAPSSSMLAQSMGQPPTFSQSLGHAIPAGMSQQAAIAAARSAVAPQSVVAPERPAPAPAPAPVAPLTRAPLIPNVPRPVVRLADPSTQEFAAVAKLSREIIERIAWEVVPELAEVLLREHVETFARQRVSRP
jgi:CheY-like chemotaxis protein